MIGGFALCGCVVAHTKDVIARFDVFDIVADFFDFEGRGISRLFGEIISEITAV